MFKFSLLSFGASGTMGGGQFMSLNLKDRLPFSVLTIGYNLKYLSFNLMVLGMYLEREVVVTDWEGNYEMKWHFFWMGLRKCTIDYLRGEKHDA